MIVAITIPYREKDDSWLCDLTFIMSLFIVYIHINENNMIMRYANKNSAEYL